jgi:pimeloyl-ACP methyl ester carboxylesterase
MANQQEITFQSGSLHLAGTLLLPGSEGQYPGVVLVAGSGRVDRNENAKKLEINAFRDIAFYLAEHGIATLRYDKRGVGESEGEFLETGFFDNVSDAFSAFGYFKAHERIRPDLVFCLGHSEGAFITTRLAATGVDMAGAILLSGAARSGEEVLQWQAEQVVKGMRGVNRWLINFLHIDVQKTQRKQLDKIRRSTKDWYRVQLIAKLNAKWMREFISYNPAEDMPKVHVPVLAITGSKDIQVDPADLGRMAELIKGEFEWHIVPNVTHILRAELGEPTLSTYKEQVRQPVDERILKLISEWLRKHVDASLPTPYSPHEGTGKRVSVTFS